MSRAVVHMKKIKSHGLKGIQFHHQRERESKTNPDIKKDKTHLNYDLHNKTKIDFNKTVKEKIKNQVVTNRKIRKDAVVNCDFIISSDKKFFENLSEDQQRNFFKKSYEFFKERYGKEKITYASVHLDEHTPHMHLGLVPITQDNKLSCKRLFNPIGLKRLQDDYPKYIQSHGYNLERGISSEGKVKHLETQEYKAKKLSESIKTLEDKRKGLKNDLKSLKIEFKELEEVKVDLDKYEKLEGKSGFLNKNKITIDKKDFDSLKKIAKRQSIFENKIDRLEYENNNMETDLSRLKSQSLKNFHKGWKKEEDLRNAKSEIKDLSSTLNFVVDFLKKIGEVDNAKDYVIKNKKLEKEKSMEKEHEITR